MDAVEPELIDWLLDGADPALAWQVERDLANAPEEQWQATRRRVVTEGFGARLLALQGDDGQWAGGAYFPAGFDFDDPGEGQPWTATTWSLNMLREFGVDGAVLAGTAAKLDANSRWEYDNLPYWGGEVDACINAFTLANGAWLGADVTALRDWFPEHQLPDGGWNWPRPRRAAGCRPGGIRGRCGLRSTATRASRRDGSPSSRHGSSAGGPVPDVRFEGRFLRSREERTASRRAP